MSSPLVSVMVPTRGRVQQLEQSLRSLLDSVSDRDNVEIIVKHDDDDEPTKQFLAGNPVLSSTVISGPRGRGYADLHLMYNEMSARAHGRYLFLWNDDAIMLTREWDRHIAAHDDGKLSYLMSGLIDGRGRDSFLFPIVHRSWYDLTGHFSMSAHNDTYVYQAFKPFPHLFRETNIVIQHNALQILNDRTSREAQQWWPTTKGLWDKQEVQSALASDIRKLAEHVNSGR